MLMVVRALLPGEPTELFTAISAGTSPEDRQLRVTKWFISTLSGQFTRREKETVSQTLRVLSLDHSETELFVDFVRSTGFREEASQSVSLQCPVTSSRLIFELKFFLSSNSFLGEQFNGQWNNGEIVLHTEQVSHHPPVTGKHKLSSCIEGS